MAETVAAPSQLKKFFEGSANSANWDLVHGSVNTRAWSQLEDKNGIPPLAFEALPSDSTLLLQTRTSKDMAIAAFSMEQSLAGWIAFAKHGEKVPQAAWDDCVKALASTYVAAGLVQPDSATQLVSKAVSIITARMDVLLPVQQALLVAPVAGTAVR